MQDKNRVIKFVYSTIEILLISIVFQWQHTFNAFLWYLLSREILVDVAYTDRLVTLVMRTCIGEAGT